MANRFSHYEIQYAGTACRALAKKWPRKRPAVHHHDDMNEDADDSNGSGREKRDKIKKLVGKLALVSGEGDCTLFEKVRRGLILSCQLFVVKQTRMATAT